MSQTSLVDLSNQLADAVESAARSVVQIQGRRQPASGVVHSSNVVVTTTRAIGGEEGITVRTPDGRTLEAELAGWDPATHLVALRAAGLDLPAIAAGAPARVGNLVMGIGRSWSNAVTASEGIVSVIGGPLPTGRGRSIEQVIRTSAQMHRGFAGGALIDAAGGLVGIATAAEIRGLGVVIPAAIAWKTVADLLEHGRTRRPRLGVAGQTVRLPAAQRPADAPATAVLVVQVIENEPAERAGIFVGDILLALDGQPLDSPDRLLELLSARGSGTALLRVLRGGSALELSASL